MVLVWVIFPGLILAGIVLVTAKYGRLKPAGIFCAVMLMICEVGSYAQEYEMGRLTFSAWFFLDPFFVAPAVVVLFLALLTLWCTSFAMRRERVWMTGIVMVLFAFNFVGPTFLMPPGFIPVYGIRDRTLHEYSVEQLREFKSDFDRVALGSDVFNGDTSSLNKSQVGAYESLQRKYSFLSWALSPGKGPEMVQETDGILSVVWGGGLMGHWGFSIGPSGQKNESESIPEKRILRVSDDIYFFASE